MTAQFKIPPRWVTTFPRGERTTGPASSAEVDPPAAKAKRRTISEPIVTRLVAACDAASILGAGVAAICWSATTTDWRLQGLVVLLAAVLGSNFLQMAGAHRL